MAKTVDYEFKRGETQVLNKFRLLDAEGKTIELGANDTIYFTVKKDAYTKDALIQKTTRDEIELGEDGYYHITLEPEDTNPLSYGEYQYDIEFKAIGVKTFVRTIIEGTITLTEEITWGGNE